MPIIPNADFRPDPKRAIFLQGRIDQLLIERLAPRIIKLQSESRAPITIYIDSLGGSTISGEGLLRLLLVSDQDSSGPCRLITVATARAASAAADMLFSGDYAIVYPTASIICHGVRTASDDPITVEAASVLTESLRVSNDQYAMDLANRANWRFIFRYTLLAAQFDEFKRSHPEAKTQLDCFVGLISEKLSRKAAEVFAKAEQRHGRYEELVDRIAMRATKNPRFANSKREADSESVILKLVIEYEWRKNSDPGWTFADGGLAQVSDDFALLREYLDQYDGIYLHQQCERWKNFFLTNEDRTELRAITDPGAKQEELLKRVKPRIRPIWLFFVALCHALQEGENELTPTDAYWLGLIDEVLGDRDLVTLRSIVEYEPDDPPAQPMDDEQVALQESAPLS